MELSTRLLLVIVPSVVGWPHYSNAGGCPDGHFPCHQDCCINAVQFCNNHGSQLRCQKCELRKAHCGTPDVHEHCFLFCDKFLAAMTTPFSTTMTDNSTTHGVTQDRSVSTPVLTSEILAAIVVPCVLVVIVSSVFVLVLCVLAKRRNWLTNTCRRVCKQKEHENDVETPLDEPPSRRDHNLRGYEPADNTPLLDSRPSGAGQPSAEIIEDPTVLSSLNKRDSDATLESKERVATSEVKEISHAVKEHSAVKKEASQQRHVSPDNSPTTSRGTYGQGDTTSLSSTSSSSDGADNSSQGRRQECQRRAGDSETRSNDRNTSGRAASTGSHTNGAPYHQRDARGPAVNQTNQTHINICTHGGCQPPPDVYVSRPPSSAHLVHSDAPTGSSSSAQAPYNPSPQCNDQRLNSKPADLARSDAPIASSSGAQASYSPSPRCNDQRLYTNPSKPPDHEQETVELATGVGNPTRQYSHLQNPIT